MEDRANILREMKICRFCLSSEENDLSNIHDQTIKNPDIPIALPVLPLQIMACLALEVVKNDNMPQYICKSCRYLTSQAYVFKSNCKKSDDALKLFLVTGQLAKPQTPKVSEMQVQPVDEKTLTIPYQSENENVVVQPQASPVRIELDGNDNMEFEEIDQDESFDVEGSKENTPSAQIKPQCFSCTECTRTFPLKQLLDLHMKNHTRDRNFECEECHNKFYTKYDLNKHILTHNEVKEFACVVCHKTFAREPMLRRHEKIHTNAPKYVCLECDKAFLTKEYLEFHLQKHNKKRAFTCKICNKSFVFKQGLERHEAIHSENKPHKCNYCEASFTSAIKLTRHITTHAGLRPYPCKICGRTFLLSHHLTRHMRSHYAAKTSFEAVGHFKCDICSMSFMKKDSLINHSAIHSMVNLKCVICNTTFESANMVKEHITTHLTDLPYPCEKCDYSFESSEQLLEHELKHAEMEYEDQIEKEVFSETIQQQVGEEQGEEQDEEDEVEEGEVTAYTILDINNPDAGIRSTQAVRGESIDGANIQKNYSQRIDFLKDEVDSEPEQEQEPEVEEEEDEEVQFIKPVIRQEGTKMYQRKNIPARSAPEVRLTALKHVELPQQQQAQQIQQQQQTPAEAQTTDLSTMAGKKIGDKVVKVQKFILTKDEMKAMAKQGILEIKNGQVVLKSGGQQILNATLKPIQKNEIDSLLDRRQTTGNKFQIKRYEKKVPSAESRQGN